MNREKQMKTESLKIVYIYLTKRSDKPLAAPQGACLRPAQGRCYHARPLPGAG